MPKLLPDERQQGRHVGRNLSRETQGFLARLPGAQASDYIPVRFKPDFRPIREIFFACLACLDPFGRKIRNSCREYAKICFRPDFSASAYISLADCTVTRLTASGMYTSIAGPQIAVTLAPLNHAQVANAQPIRPVEGLDQKRTPSQNSRVGPSVTSTFLPAYPAGKARAGQPEKFRAILPACLVLPRHRRCPQCLA